jgi:Ca-activated chloride channel family protein
MNGIEFEYPAYFYLLLILVPYIGWYVWKNNRSQASLQLTGLERFQFKSRGLRVYLRHIPFIIRMVVIALLITILARPQSTEHWKNSTTEGIDIVLALDISSSMLAQDFKPNRIEAAKDIAIQFISGRPYDRIGLVVFSGESFTQCPLTTDHAVLINLFKEIKSGMIEDGTAIGLGLANAVNRLKESSAKSKVIILLTDGENNTGEIAPLTAADIAKTYGVRVYTIGVGSKGTAPYPMQGPFGRTIIQQVPTKIDEATLKRIAHDTNGEYFRATSNYALKNIYEEIDKLEKSKIDVTEHSKKDERYLPFAILAFVLLGMEVLLRQTVLRSIP